MKKFTLLLQLLACVILVSSCSTSRFVMSDVKPTDISDMAKFEPYTNIGLIEVGNIGSYSDSVSACSKAVVNECLEGFRANLPLAQGEIRLANPVEENIFGREIAYLLTAAERRKAKTEISITPFIDSLLTANGKRFGLIVAQSGFTRVKGNYGNQVALGLVLGILSLGSYIQTPIKSNSTLFVMIVDSEKKNVAFYEKQVLGCEPTEKLPISVKLAEIFGSYFGGKYDVKAYGYKPKTTSWDYD